MPEARPVVGASLPKKAFAFRVPAKPSSFEPRGFCTTRTGVHGDEIGDGVCHVEQARHSAWDRIPVASLERTLVLERGPLSAREPSGRVFRPGPGGRNRAVPRKRALHRCRRRRRSDRWSARAVPGGPHAWRRPPDPEIRGVLIGSRAPENRHGPEGLARGSSPRGRVENRALREVPGIMPAGAGTLEANPETICVANTCGLAFAPEANLRVTWTRGGAGEACSDHLGLASLRSSRVSSRKRRPADESAGRERTVAGLRLALDERAPTIVRSGRSLSGPFHRAS